MERRSPRPEILGNRPVLTQFVTPHNLRSVDQRDGFHGVVPGQLRRAADLREVGVVDHTFRDAVLAAEAIFLGLGIKVGLALDTLRFRDEVLGAPVVRGKAMIVGLLGGVLGSRSSARGGYR